MKKLILFSILALSASHVHAAPCGLVGTISERVRDCASQSSGLGDFTLVARTVDGREVILNRTSGHLWTSMLNQKLTYEEAMNACHNTASAVNGLDIYNWRLPTKTDFEVANRSGITGVVTYPQVQYRQGLGSSRIWTASKGKFDLESFWEDGDTAKVFGTAFMPDTGSFENQYRQDHYPVQCVADLTP